MAVFLTSGFYKSQRAVFVSILCMMCMLISVEIKADAQAKKQVDLQSMLAQKLLIDLRYYCPKDLKQTSDAKQSSSSRFCQRPLTTLPRALSDMLGATQVGGVILFSENLQNSQQILQLTHDLQQSVVPSSHLTHNKSLPLYIAVDQEGGRVSRLPDEEFLGFAGNMALGATYQKQGVSYATEVAENMAQALYALGFNLNFAPSLDVNSNPNNPIINVRSYSENPQWVAKLGEAQIRGFQSQGIAAAAKHFPGHGDTYVDSHVGLPRVAHSKEQIDAIDLMPFKYVIEHADVDMIMTAHIQYPALDSSTFVSTKGLETELPATLSHRILTGLLRNELQYEGLIVTDALDMAAISQFLTPLEATMKAFYAGADIALMPFKISSNEDAMAFIKFLEDLTAEVAKDEKLIAKVTQSYNRIVAHKQKRNMLKHAQQELASKQAALNKLTSGSQSQKLALSLSSDAFTEIKALPNKLKVKQSIHAVMPDKRRCKALLHYLKKAGFKKLSCVSLLSQQIKSDVQADVIIVGDVSPQLSFFESREFEGISASHRLPIESQLSDVERLLATSNASNKILLKLRSPYIDAADLVAFDGIYASYDYQVSGEGDTLFAPAFDSLVKVLNGSTKAKGTAPVSILQGR